ncbi:uncharacterized protein BDV17DRAFT_296618 [Aspergillus undulatus]|uniref:uncharacterized protein n=1 Tax=Aspergillus undulatus TaxID=1810928 RepID=UPI003CCCB02D
MAYNLNAETFSGYGIGVFFLVLRFIARLKMGGVRGLRLDDAFAVLAVIFFTMQTVNIYRMDILGTNIGLNAETAMAVPREQNVRYDTRLEAGLHELDLAHMLYLVLERGSVLPLLETHVGVYLSAIFLQR